MTQCILKRASLASLIASGMDISQIRDFRESEQVNRIAYMRRIVGWILSDEQAEKALAHFDYMKSKPFRYVQDDEIAYQALRIAVA